MQTRDMPLALRLAGCWLIWSAWCSVSGWLLSAIGQLDGAGHLLLLPVLVACVWRWLKATAPAHSPIFSPLKKNFRRLRRPAPLVFAAIALLSLAAGFLYAPWSFDAVTYRLPRLLHWNAAHHWYWIGTLDHRLDFISCGQEWQMLPLIELTHTDRFLFLLNWIPFLLMPALVFTAFRGLGVNGRSARLWMWLLPAGYCYALQCSGIQNDGYTADFTLGAVGFAVAGFRSNRGGLLLMSALAAALLTGAKLSNLPLLLPLGLLLLPALRQLNWVTWKIPTAAVLLVLCSFIPLASLSLKFTGDWTGDPTDQWNIKIHHPLGGAAANVVILANDMAQPPLLPGSGRINTLVESVEHGAGPVFAWLKSSHGQFPGIHFGQMVYEGDAGLGFGLGIYLLCLIAGVWLVKSPPSQTRGRGDAPAAWRFALWSAWMAYGVYLAKAGSYHSARLAAPYYPLLLASILQWPRIARLERRKLFLALAWLAALTVVPVILLTPARPLVPIQIAARLTGKPSLEKIAAKYRVWSVLRDDLAPLRDALPPGTTKLGYAGAFRDTSYGLWKPLGSRVVLELGLPLGGKSKPPADLNYAAVTDSGLQQRYGMDLKTWLDYTGGTVLFEFQRNAALDTHSAPEYESWYLVQFALATAKPD